MNSIVHANITAKAAKTDNAKDFEFFERLHSFMDSSKEVESTQIHRIFTHTMFFIKQVMIPVYGNSYICANGKVINIKDTLETDHIVADFRGRFLPNLSDYVDLIQSNKATSDALDQIEKHQIEYAEFLQDNPDILDQLNAPLFITGSKLSLLITWNSWWLGKIVPLVFKKKVPFIGVSPKVLFGNMDYAEWIANGEGLPPSQKNVDLYHQNKKAAKNEGGKEVYDGKAEKSELEAFKELTKKIEEANKVSPQKYPLPYTWPPTKPWWQEQQNPPFHQQIID